MLREFRLTGRYLEKARGWVDDPAELVEPRQAATVLLVRDGDDGVEVFMQRRRLSMAFAGGMFAFPGGGVDPRDAETDVPWAGPSPPQWARDLGATPQDARAFVCAAVRETFEECGVLLAGHDTQSVLSSVDGDEWESERQRLLSRETAMSGLLRRRRLVLRSDLLRAWAHWTTPVHEPRRFDTRFFVALVPDGQAARHVGGESDESGWMRPREVLERFRSGEVLMLPPTIVTVEEVAAARDATTLWKQARHVREVMPVIERRGDDVVMVADLPDQPSAP